MLDTMLWGIIVIIGFQLGIGKEHNDCRSSCLGTGMIEWRTLRKIFHLAKNTQGTMTILD
jgi:hypothetical protein